MNMLVPVLICRSDSGYRIIGIRAQDQRIYGSHGVGKKGFHQQREKYGKKRQSALRRVDAAQAFVVQFCAR